MRGGFLIYGANGYTGALIAREAARRGLAPILAGRSAEPLVALANQLALPYEVVALEDRARLVTLLEKVGVVIHAAGPFSRTSRPMVDACLAARTHYLDITGEIPVFEACFTRSEEAKQAGVMLLPGSGFDVVPSDCLAAHLKHRFPGATRLALGFQAGGRPSRGTATTMLENVPKGGVVRRGGVLTPVPAAYKTRVIDFGRGPTGAVTIPWGDVSTAYHTTAIPDIEFYMAAPFATRVAIRATRYLGPALGSAGIQRFLKRRIDAGPPGPDEKARARHENLLWGEASDSTGTTFVSRMRTPEGYDLTVLSSLAIAARVLGGEAPTGFQTPARAYGKDFALAVPGVTRQDLA
ncbi:MAG: saccharopine dehydrogenase NADP-binding domain-containing protein [Acidobacteriota bacterium]